ncbi:MAG: stage II sporulation protein M [Bacteroidetes bacterium]|nr:stage II sporulation protein M [Bacteroidota bacterium]
MKEITFLKQNSKKWENYETVVKEKKHNPAQLTEMFIEITDDLSYTKTNYNNSKTHFYINGLASKIHQLIYQNKKERSDKLITFYKNDLPGMFAKYHKQLLYSFIITAVATLIGVVSQIYDDTFARLILGDYYVDSTIERIKMGDPLGIYGEENQFLMFVQITLNNIKVSFYACMLGIFAGLGTAILLVQNGIMLGCFFTLFYQYNVMGTALKVVWIHGTLEISAIIIAGCAGLMLGNSILFPKTHARLYSFKQGVKNAFIILIGLIPVFIVAGFLESFVTRYTQMPLITALSIIGVSLLFIIWYFIVLPIKIKNNQVLCK